MNHTYLCHFISGPIAVSQDELWPHWWVERQKRIRISWIGQVWSLGQFLTTFYWMKNAPVVANGGLFHSFNNPFVFRETEDPMHSSWYLLFWKVLENKGLIIVPLLTLPGCSTAGLLGGGSVSIGGGVGGGGAPTDVVQHQQESCCSLQLKTGVQVGPLTTTVFCELHPYFV